MSLSDTPDATSELHTPAVTYFFRPSLFGAPREFTVSSNGLSWTSGARSGSVALDRIRRVRLSYRPMSMQPHRFRAEIWADGAPKLDVISTSWKGLMEQERRDADYTVFIRALHRGLADIGSRARFETGTPALLYWPGLVVFALFALGMAALVVRALQTQAYAGALVIAAFFGFFVWTGYNFFRRNRPGTYGVEAVPPAVLPGG